MQINTPVNESLIPIGELKEDEGSVVGFTEAKPIGKDIQVENEQLKYGKGFDHNYVLSGTNGKGMNHAATIKGKIGYCNESLYRRTVITIL